MQKHLQNRLRNQYFSTFPAAHKPKGLCELTKAMDNEDEVGLATYAAKLLNEFQKSRREATPISLEKDAHGREHLVGTLRTLPLNIWNPAELKLTYEDIQKHRAETGEMICNYCHSHGFKKCNHSPFKCPHLIEAFKKHQTSQ